jgi:hypothetical protein
VPLYLKLSFMWPRKLSQDGPCEPRRAPVASANSKNAPIHHGPLAALRNSSVCAGGQGDKPFFCGTIDLGQYYLVPSSLPDAPAIQSAYDSLLSYRSTFPNSQR